jgi:uncharacterized protein involved in exopolysaccharide biosynthesis
MREKEEDISLVDVYLKLRDTVRFLWTKKISILIAGALGGAIGLAYSIIKPLEYESKLSFIAEQKGSSSGLGALSGIANSFGFGAISEGGGLYDNQVNLMNYLKSRSVMEEAYLSIIPGTKTTFAQRFAQEYGWRKEWDQEGSLSHIKLSSNDTRENFSLKEDSVLYEIYKYTIEEGLINVSLPDEEGSIVLISFKTLDDTLTKFFPEVLLSVVTKNYTETKTRQARENVALLQRQTDSVRAELNASLVGLATSTDQILGLNPGFNVKRVPATKQQIDVQASTVLMGELIKNLELAKVQLKDQTPLIEVIDSPRFPLEKITISKKNALIVSSLLFAVLTALGLIIHRFVKKITSS